MEMYGSSNTLSDGAKCNKQTIKRKNSTQHNCRSIHSVLHSSFHSSRSWTWIIFLLNWNSLLRQSTDRIVAVLTAISCITCSPACQHPFANTPCGNTPCGNTPCANTPCANTPCANILFAKSAPWVKKTYTPCISFRHKLSSRKLGWVDMAVEQCELCWFCQVKMSQMIFRSCSSFPCQSVLNNQICHLFRRFSNSATWWPNLHLDIQPKWRHLVAKFASNPSGTTWWPILQPIQVRRQILNSGLKLLGK